MQLWCIYSAFGFIGLFLIGWIPLAHFVPPSSPAAAAEEIAQLYRDNLMGIRIGMVLAIFSSALLLPWGAAVCAQMQRIEGRRAPLTWAWIAAQGCVVIEFVYPCSFWLVAAFRPEDASRVQTFNDMGWMPFMGIVCTGMFQMVALAAVVLRDPRPKPVFPRWFAFFQLWCAAGVGLTFGVWIFKTGPLAWDGLLGFWIPASTYFTWVLVTTIVTGQSIKRDDGADLQYEDDVVARLLVLEQRLNMLDPERRG